MITIRARQIQLTKMSIRKTVKVLYIVSNIFSRHIAHKFLLQPFDSHHFTTHIYPKFVDFGVFFFSCLLDSVL